MSRISNAHTVNIVSPPTTVLARIAAAMLPGEWVYLDGATRTVGVTPNITCTIPANINLYPGGLADVAATDGRFSYCNKAKWNSTSKTIEFHGTGAHVNTPSYTWYDETTNAFGAVFTSLAQGSHGFDFITVNPYTGKVWQRSTGPISGPMSIFTYSSQATNPPWPVGATIPHGSYIGGVDWWTGAHPWKGSQGMLVCQNAFEQLWIDTYNPVSGLWTSIQVTDGYSNPTNQGSYNGVCVYSTVKNCVIFGGMNWTPNTFWRFNSDATVTRLAATPIGVGTNRSQIIEEPVTGKFLVSSIYGFYELNPDGAGTWTRLPDTPALVNKWRDDGSCVPASVWFSLPDHGCVGVVSTQTGSARMHLYKHA